MLSTKMYIHTREYYNLLDMLGDLGGIVEIIITFIGLFVLPVSEFGYHLKVIQKLFVINSKLGNELFEKKAATENPVESQAPYYHNFNISLLSQLHLFIT